MTTHVSQSTSDDASLEPRESTQRKIVVGVDTRGRSVSALVWAVEQAARDSALLTLVSARHVVDPSTDRPGEHDVISLARRLTLAQVETRAVVGDPVETLLQAAADADLLAVGCRSMRPAQRMVVGSTSRAVACWSPVPVVVVPEGWIQPSMATAPVVAGVRPMAPDQPGVPTEKDAEVLDFAFAQAAALKVPLIVVSAWEIPAGYGWSPEDIADIRSQYDASLNARLTPWKDVHPEVEVVACGVAEEPDQALLDASRVAQLVVMGRHHSNVLSGMLGSTARGVLSHASRPVAVVPAGRRVDLVRELRARAGSAATTWAPTF